MVNQDLNIGELIPEVSPNVEGKIIICLAKEVKLSQRVLRVLNVNSVHSEYCQDFHIYDAIYSTIVKKICMLLVYALHN